MRLRKHIILYTGERERETLFFINYRKYFLGLLCIENYSKSLTVQCNRPIRMVFAAHTFQYHLEYCERQMTNFKIKFGSIGKNSNQDTLTLHIASLNHKIVVTSVMAVDMSHLMTLIEALKMISIHNSVPTMQSI